ncbi:glycosyltransferase family 4 protein [Bacteroides sp. L10-4]|uniref:glycosyltransferase family 4 protein n=1 Tax=Bacteroides sp. L10-4 TaxID=2746063 RepID=UPI0015959DA5|nr:glycosyltransferase family 4 protein [Bacteroides sp. L10-4]NVK93102.1 glycosyltransferase family 4 protein [Bacteroides sp. L10-4]
MKKILFCNNCLSGLIHFRKEVIDEYEKMGYEIVIVVAKQKVTEVELEKLSKKWKVNLVSLSPNSINPFSDLKYFWELYMIYKKELPDIIFHYTIKPNIYGTIAARLLKLPCVAMVAGLGYVFEGNSLKKRIGRSLYKFSLRRSNKIICLNAANAEVLLNGNYCKPNNLIWFKGGEGVNLDLYPYKPMRFETTKFLMIARVLYDKGYTEYVEAAKIIKRKYPNIEIELLGALATDSPMGVPEEIVKSDHNNGFINYLGTTNDVPSYVLRDGVVVVLVSKYLEGLNKSLMEACSMGRPIITTTNPGCQETVENGVNGFLIPPGNHIALAEAMIKFIELPQNRKKEMAEASNAKAKKDFDIRIVLDYYKSITKDIVMRNI